MARVLLDKSVAGEAWFKKAVTELAGCSNVKFLYSDDEKYRNEVLSVEFLAKFLKLMKDKGKREDTDATECRRIIDELEGRVEFKREQACDDPHLFAIVFQKPDPFIFTSDKRILDCRRCMATILDKRYRDFSTIQTEENYKANSARIRA
jgi:hypothetical protein